MKLNFLLDKKSYSKRVDYILRVIGRRLGYPYAIIFDRASAEPDDLTIGFLSEIPLGLAENDCQLYVYSSGQIDDLETAEREIDLLKWRQQTLSIIGNHWDKPASSGWRKDKNSIYYHKSRAAAWIIPFDLYLNVFYHLSRYEEKWRHFTEETATDYSTSLLSRHQELRFPLVDILLFYFDQIIREKIDNENKCAVRILPWPGGEDMGVAFTHDVDITRGVPLMDRVLQRGKEYLLRLSGDSVVSSKIDQSIRMQDEKAWNFPELISFYQEKNWKATFFFIAKKLEGSHFRYNIASKKFRTLFKDLKNAGHEIALHPSRYAFDKPQKYRDEKKRLEAITEIEISGMRQHYLRAKFPRLWVLAEKAGLRYDASLGYNYQAGFRAGTSHPFKTYDVFEDKPLSLTEFSLALFENNLAASEETKADAERLITSLVDQVCKYQGLLVSLLHPNNYANERYAGFWKFMQAQLKGKNIFVATLNEHLNWQRMKERIKISFSSPGSDEREIEITLVEGQKKVAIECVGDFEPVSCENAIFKHIHGGQYALTANSHRFVLKIQRKMGDTR